MTSIESAVSTWIHTFLEWLTPRRLRAQAIVLALCLWGVCAADFATPGLFDRAGNIKFQDFLPFYISARLISQHRSDSIYDRDTQRRELESIVGRSQVELPYLYGPQVALLFVPLANLWFPIASGIWTALSLVVYFGCIFVVWRCCPQLQRDVAPFGRATQITPLAALAFPPLFHVFVRGQISALILLCFTGAFMALRFNRNFLAGIVLGFLILKPQFLVAIPLIFLFGRAWKALIGLLLSATGQLAFARFYFGSSVMDSYLNVVLHPQRWLNVAELSLAPIQMHSLRAFWTLLIPSPSIAIAFYALSSILAIVVAVRVWRSQAPTSLRYSALIIAASLVNPHLFIYDLIVLAPALLLTVDWCLANRQRKLTSSILVLCYLAFVLPLFGPLSRWTHMQPSVIAFAALLWTLSCFGRIRDLASPESLVV